MNAYKIVLLLIIIVFSVINSYHDIRDMKVYDYPLLAACYSVILCHMLFERENLWVYILSGMISGAFYYFIRLVTRKKLGIGDVYFGFFQGLCLPLITLPICVLLEIVLALMVINKKFGKATFPFVPFMAMGLLGAYCTGLFFL